MKKKNNNNNTKLRGPKISPGASLGFILLALAFIGLDQWSKYWVITDSVLQEGGQHVLIDGFLNFRYTFNTGAAWSFLAEKSWGIYLLTGISIIASLVFLVFLVRSSGWPKFLPFTFSLLLAGTVGNLIDRIRLGGVIDFVDVVFGDWHFPTFNVADSLIVVGMIFLLIYILFFEEKHRNSFMTDERYRLRRI